jgi:predicted outer membrane protein
MSAFWRLKVGMLAAALSCLVIASAWAEREIEREYEGTAQSARTADQSDQTRQQGQQYRAQFRGTPGSKQNEPVQQFVVACLLDKNRGEVELGQYAQQQSQNPKVKEFARMLVEDHQKIVQQLEQLQGNQGTRSATSPSLGTTQSDAQRRAADTTRIPGSSDAGQPEQGLTATRTAGQQDAAVQQLIQIDHQINERFGQAVREELQQKQGAEFDKCFVGSQIASHMHSLAALEVLSQQGPDQVRQLAQQAEPKVREHLEHAKQLMKQLDSMNPTSQAERQSTRTQR